jgi:pyroglutamyl-peptidase
MKKVLVTGFEPFSGRKWNVTQEVLPFLSVEGASLHTLVLPVTYAGCFLPVRKEYEAFRPDLLVSLGEASYDALIVVERRARNRMLSKCADNDGVYQSGAPIEPGGPEFRYGTADLSLLRKASLTKEVPPLSFSGDAGGFICNKTYYEDLRLTEKTQTQAVFFHLSNAAFDYPALGYNISVLIGLLLKEQR